MIYSQAGRAGLALCVMAAVAASGPSARAQQGPPAVDVATPLAAEVVDFDDFTGRFEAVNRVEVRSRVSGYLQHVRFRDGQRVGQGAILFEIDPRPFAAEVDRALADLAQARANQTRAEAELRRANQLVLNRTVSETTLDEREAEKLSADAAVAAAEARVRSAQLDLEFAEIRAPLAGRISDRQADVGNLVTGGPAGATLLATIVQTNPIFFVFDASEADYLKYTRLFGGGEDATDKSAAEAKKRALLRLRDEAEFTHEGQVDFFDIELDPNAGTIRIRAEFENDEGLFTPGLFGRVRLAASRPYDALLVPDRAVLSDQARKIVYVVDAEGVVAPRPVTLGPIFRGLRVVREGLSAEDQVIVAGLLRARPDQKVSASVVTLEFQGPALDLGGRAGVD